MVPLLPGRLPRQTGPVLLLLSLVTCAPQGRPSVGPAPGVASSSGGPTIRIGLRTGAPRVDLSGDSGLTLTDGDGAFLAVLESGLTWRIRPDGAGLTAVGPGGRSVTGQRLLTLTPRSAGGLVAVGTARYRGSVTLVRDRGGITIVNSLGLEDYLRGVVGAEMGRRDPGEDEALVAQAIVSRTFAIRNLGKRAEQGFDLYASTVDQVYASTAAEYPMAVKAVDRTAGLVLTWNGAPIDAFFFSTCAGRTADGTEVFAGADRPYLSSVTDRDGSGEALCRISPRYRWREEWTGEELRGILRQSLPQVSSATAADVDEVRGVAVDRQTRSGRVAQVSITLGKREVSVSGPAVRQALHPIGQEVLRSAMFELHQSVSEGRITRLVADGHGAGHGVGFCQWGAVGRARAGQSAIAMLTAYFPGTQISRAY